MSYQVIARKYRPQRFSEVIGQEHVTQTLSNAIKQNRIAHAYLFVGPRGTGKTTIARIFAKCLNCTGGPLPDFPDDDPRCQEIVEGRAMDVLEIDGASNRGIEEIRELRETVKYAPSSSRFKIYIIDEVHMLTKEAFNALLKTLEEPPAHVKFMFATTEPEKVLPTILSRCQRFDLRRIPSRQIVDHLAQIATKENVSIDEAALFAIARGAEGGMRDAESTLDQLISFCGNQITENDVLSMFGLAARKQLLALADAVIKGDAAEALGQLNDLARNGKDLSRLLSDLLTHFRNLLVYSVSNQDTRLLDVSEAELGALKEQIKGLNTETLTRIMEVLSHAEGRLKDAASRKIFLEMTLLKAIEARKAVSIDSVLSKLQQLRNDGGNGSTGGQSPSPSPAPKASVQPARQSAIAPQKTAPVSDTFREETKPAEPVAQTIAIENAPTPQAASAPSATAPDLENLWSQALETIGRASGFLRSYLLEAHPVSISRNVFTIGFDPEFRDHIGLVDNSKNHLLIQTKLAELGHRDVQIKFVVAPTPANRPRPAAPTNIAPAPARTSSATGEVATARKAEPAKSAQTAAPPVLLSVEEFKNDPLIKKALEIFKGQIVEVRA